MASDLPPPPPDDIAPMQSADGDHRFPCTTCGADYRYDPVNATLTCDHCGDTQMIAASPWDANAIRELDFDSAIGKTLDASEMEETRVSTCPNCAAQVEFDPDAHAAECPFCATPVVTDTGVHRHIKPRGVLPFAVDERSAHKAMTDWLGRLWFAPNGLKEYARKGRKMQGIYVPYWTFDADTRSSYTGLRGDVYYETRTVVIDGKRQKQKVPKIRWTPVSGRVARNFDDILVLATRSLPKSYTDALQPWDLPELEPYRPEYLAGFRAEAYTVDLEHGHKEARQIIARRIERDVRFDIGGDQQQVSSIRSDIRDETFKHILLPVWLAAYKFRGKTYRFVVNGRSGRVQGERPWSAMKLTIAIVFGLLVAAGLGYVFATQQ